MRRFPLVSGLAAFSMAGIMWSAPHTADAQLAQQAYVKAGNPQNQAQFGRAVAISGNTMVVGANQEGTGAAKSGAAYVFVRTGDTWTQQAFLKADNAQLNDEFGISVAISGDTIVVGAWNEDGNDVDNSAYNSGAAYVFTRSGTTWSQQAFLKASNPDTNDYFGRVVAISGNTIVVGSYFENSNATTVNGDGANNSAENAGAAYVYFRTGTTWAQQAYLKANNAGAGDLYGSSVAVHGNTVVVGAPGEASNATTVNGNAADNTAVGAGAAYVYLRTGTTWAHQAYLKASNAQANDYFGDAVAVSLDGIAVGAWREYSNATGIGGNQADNSQFFAGAVYLYSRTGTAWSQQAYVKASNTNGGDEFAGNLAMSGGTLVVGAMKEASNSPGVNGNQANNSLGSAGAAYVFTGVPGAAAAPIRVTSVTKSGNNMTILFSSAAGLGGAGWVIEGSPALQGWPDAMTASSTITEVTAGNYRAIVNVTGKPAGKYFLRVAR